MKIAIKIEGKEYILELQEEFADYMQKDLERLSTSSTKELLHLLLKRSHDCFLAQKKLQELLKKL